MDKRSLLLVFCFVSFYSLFIYGEQNVFDERYSLSNLKLSNFCISWVTPERYGAKGDGVSDDTEAFLKALGSGKRIRCDGQYRLRKESLPKTKDGHLIFPSLSHHVKIYGKGTILYDFHINVKSDIIVHNLRLVSTDIEPNGLFAISNNGSASFKGVCFDGALVGKVNGGIASRGKLIVSDCIFFQSDINVIAPNGFFSIKDSHFDANYANGLDHLSNELIHIQTCESGEIIGCRFMHSKQDIVDFYFGAKNVIFERNIVIDNEATLFEIKAEYRDTINSQGGNQFYNDYTSGITIRNNKFVVSKSIAWVGTRSDTRINKTKDDYYSVKNVVISNNEIEVQGDNKVDLFYARNVKGLKIVDNNINSSSAPLFLLRIMSGENYEACENVDIRQNKFRCPSFVGCYIEGRISTLTISYNHVEHISCESYLILQKDDSITSDTVSVSSNESIGKCLLRLGAPNRPLKFLSLVYDNQRSDFVYVGLIKSLSVSRCIAPIICLNGVIDTLIIEKCDRPTFISKHKGTEVKLSWVKDNRTRVLYDKNIRVNKKL